MAEVSDEEQLAYAATARRTLLTCNAQDFAPLYEDYWFAGREHSGVVVSEQVELGEMLRRVVALLEAVPADDMRNAWKNLAEYHR